MTAKRIKKLVPKKFRKKELTQPSPEQTLGEGIPRITNETVAEHREQVIGSARKYIYPLQHSKHKIVLISTTLFIAAFIGFFTYTMLALYKFKSNTSFLYGVTQVVPLPVAKAGSRFVTYEDYLFELRHYIHYYQTQQKLDFNSTLGKQQLEDYKKRSLNKVIDDAYIKQLADQHKVSVSNRELEDLITVVRNQNRLGANEKGFEDVLKDNFGWSVGDFKRELKQQLLAQKVVASLDTETQNKAKTALAELKSGSDFAAVAKKYSDDPSKDGGGEFGFPVDKTNRDIPPQTTDALFALKAGQISDIVNTGYTLEIVKNIEVQGDKIKAAHIVFNLKDISTYVNDQKDKQKAKVYIKL
ncbi:MAG TPA: peptidylprolyl isomerase [Candidatus Saccharimonadales bacterium]|nr:peptidylprolyl isomerase [Candidatus Saccharimonadales bacterium]